MAAAAVSDDAKTIDNYYIFTKTCRNESIGF